MSQKHEIVDTVETAEIFRVSENTVRQWIRAGMPVVKRGARGAGKKAQIKLRDAIGWFVEYDALDAAKTRLATEQADKLALENAKHRQEHGEWAVWRSGLEALFGEIKSQLLAIPTKEAPHLDGNVNQRKEHLERVVRAVLSRLATYQPDVATGAVAARTSSRADGAQSATEADSIGMGRSQSKAVARDKRRTR